jgi:CRISPR/Cas system-associated exonuclease Cas4 (RecB family)
MDNEAGKKLYKSISDANEDRDMHHWHASSLAMCPKAHYMMRKKIPATSTPTAAKILRWQAGHLMEEAIREHVPALFDSQVEVLSNQRLTSEAMDLTGEYDNYVESEKTIVEVKTVHDYAFKESEGMTYLKAQDGNHPNGNKKWIPKLTPHLNHEMQNHAYVMLLREKGLEVSKIKYVYISLSGRIVVYNTDVQQDILNNITKRLEVLSQAWSKDEPPECICKEGHPFWSNTMQYCPYQSELGCCEIIKGEK